MYPVACNLLSKGSNSVVLHGRGGGGKTAVAMLSTRRGISRSSRPRNLRLSSTSKNNHNNKQQKPSIHSSAKPEQSTPTTTTPPTSLSMEQQAIDSSTRAASTATPLPTTAQLKVLFTASAVPMIGFGFMDNLVMIQAGQFIDNTIGVTLGLATMTAAAMGQVVSDVSGVIFGGSLERFLHRYKLIKASTLTSAQRSLPVCRNVAMLGAVCGVALGCGLGASCLMFMDLEARERAERALQLQAVLNDMMMEAESPSSASSNDDNDDGTLRHCESCTIHLLHDPNDSHHNVFSTQYTNKGKTRIDILPKRSVRGDSDGGDGAAAAENDDGVSLALLAAEGAKSLLNHSGSVLCTPILSQDGEVVAVLEFHIKKDDASVHGFTPEDEKAARVMSRHIGIFMHRLSD